MPLRRLRAGHEAARAAVHRLRGVPGAQQLGRQRSALRVAEAVGVEAGEWGRGALLLDGGLFYWIVEWGSLKMQNKYFLR